MPGSEPRRSIAPLALPLLLAMACGGSERESTLQSGTGEANPAGLVRSAEDGVAGNEPTGLLSRADVVPATPTTLAAHVESKARALASRPYLARESTLPRSLTSLDYEAYRAIRFRPERAIWREASDFSIQLFHPGPLYRTPVRIHLVDDEGVEPLPFDPSLFDYTDAPVGPSDQDRVLGYAGFRIHHPLNDPSVADEIAVFQGASYFRLVGPGQVHGLSSRGLGVGIGSPEEEFPAFTEFWLVQPEPDASTLVFHALLDGPSVTGAYRFELEPGSATVLDVRARLFARTDVEKLGVAPMSSMYLFGPDRADDFDDFRAAVHDSDGLMMLTRAGEWLWRPLANRWRLHVTSLRDGDPQGFGLAQRARDFDGYLDLQARYDRRPSEWVEIEGDWGVGGVELLEMPTDSEFNDNVAVSWVPDEPFLTGQEREYRYRLVTFDDRLPAQTLAQVARTRVGHDALPGSVDAPPSSQRRIVVDFVGGPDGGVGRGGSPDPVLDTTAGTISDVGVAALPADEGWRVSFSLRPDGVQPADMRLHLARDGARVSETWSWVWYPDELDAP